MKRFLCIFYLISLCFLPSALRADGGGELEEILAIRDEISSGRFLFNESFLAKSARQMELARILGDSTQVGWAHISQGIAWRNSDNLGNQLDHLFRAVAMGELTGDLHLLSEASYELGNTYISFAISYDPLKAYNFLHKALDLFEKRGDTLGVCKSLIDLGLVHSNKREHDSSFAHYQRAEQLAIAKGDSYSLGRISNNRADIFLTPTRYNPDSSLFYSLEALKLNSRHPRTRAVALLNQGIAESRMGLEELGLQHLHAGIALAEHIRPSNMFGAGCKAIYEIYLKRKDYEKALEFHQCFVNKSNFFRGEKESSHIEMISRTTERELELARKEASLRETRLTYQRILLWGSVIGILILLLWVWQIIRKNRVIRGQYLRLEEQNVQGKQMLAEIHHRVKNNLQMIVGLLDLQHAAIGDPALSGALNDARTRVNSIALIHQKLYKGHGDRINLGFRQYVKELCEHLLYVYRLNGKIELHLEVEDIKISFNRAVNLGLLLNELVTNSLKHAFNDDIEGWIRVVVKNKDTGLLIQVADNGPGFPENFGSIPKSSLGMDLIESFSSDLGGEPIFRTESGAVVEILLKLEYDERS